MTGGRSFAYQQVQSRRNANIVNFVQNFEPYSDWQLTPISHETWIFKLQSKQIASEIKVGHLENGWRRSTWNRPNLREKKTMWSKRNKVNFVHKSQPHSNWKLWPLTIKRWILKLKFFKNHWGEIKKKSAIQKTAGQLKSGLTRPLKI